MLSHIGRVVTARLSVNRLNRTQSYIKTEIEKYVMCKCKSPAVERALQVLRAMHQLRIKAPLHDVGLIAFACPHSREIRTLQ